MILVFHKISEDHGIKKSCDFMHRQYGSGDYGRHYGSGDMNIPEKMVMLLQIRDPTFLVYPCVRGCLCLFTSTIIIYSKAHDMSCTTCVGNKNLSRVFMKTLFR